jgi:hypothetical protein
MRCLLALLCIISARAEAPELKAIHPIGAGRGSTNTYTLSGKFDPWPPKFWSEPAGLTFKTDTNKNKVSIEIPSDCPPGPRLIRLYNEDGASEPKFFVIGKDSEQNEKEPNSKLSESQETKVSTIINGRLDKNDDVDSYKIDLKTGEWLDARLEAYTLMSKMDPVLRLVTTKGVTLTWNHDYENFDPHLWWRAPSNQTVIVQVFGFAYPANSDIRLTGGDEAFYRLYLTSTAPPNWTESQSATNFPLEVTGTISKPGEEDKISFAAKKDQHIEARIEAATIGSPFDPWLKIVDAEGKQMAKQEDSNGTPDPRLEWKCTADTNYYFVVGSTLNRGGTNFRYRLTANVVGPDFAATWDTKSLVMTADSTNTVKINFKRLRDHTNEITSQFHNLPTGVAAITTNLPAKSGDVSFSLVVSPEAQPFQGPIRLALIDAQAKAEKFALVELTARGEDNGVPNGYNTLAIESYDSIWLTIKPQPPKTVATNTASK